MVWTRDTFTLTQSRWGAFWGLIVCLMLLVVILIPVFGSQDWAGRPVNDGKRLMLGVFAIMAGCGVVWFVIDLFRPGKLTLTTEGFEFSGWKAVVRWEDVEHFRLIYMRPRLLSRGVDFTTAPPGVRMIAFSLNPEAQRQGLMERWHRNVAAGADGTIPDIKPPIGDLIGLMEDWRRRHG